MADSAPAPVTYDFGWPAGRDSAVVRSLAITRGNIFTAGEPEASQPYARIANALHIVTQEHVIRRGLYFARGDTITAADLAASVRRLRSYPFLKTRIDIDILGCRDSVDVHVRTSDVWSTRPELRLSRSGELFNWFFGLRESNLLGLGKELAFQVGRDDQKTFGSASYADPQLLGSEWRLGFSASTGEDLRAQGGTLWKPFDRPATRWGLRIEGEGYRGLQIDRRGGLDGPEWETRRWSFAGRAGIRILGDHRGALRLHAFAHLISERYTPPEDSSDWYPPPDRHRGRNAYADLRPRQIRGVGLMLTLIEERFRQLTQVDALGRYEDIDFGTRLGLGAGYSPVAWGARQDALLLRLEGRQGFALGRRDILRLRSSGFGLLAGGRLQDMLLRASARLHARLDGHQTLAVGIRGDYGVRLAPQRFPTLGADNGLRGFDAYRFWGERAVLANLEDRVLVAEDLFGLVSIGLAAFTDLGTTWLAGSAEAARPRIGAGVGLRLQASRTSGVLVTRLDLGYPLVGGEPEDGWVFSFASGQAF